MAACKRHENTSFNTLYSLRENSRLKVQPPSVRLPLVSEGLRRAEKRVGEHKIARVHTRVHTPTCASSFIHWLLGTDFLYFLSPARHRAFIENVSNDFSPRIPSWYPLSRGWSDFEMLKRIQQKCFYRIRIKTLALHLEKEDGGSLKISVLRSFTFSRYIQILILLRCRILIKG